MSVFCCVTLYSIYDIDLCVLTMSSVRVLNQVIRPLISLDEDIAQQLLNKELLSKN